jgi:hypothetical protein
MALTRLGLNQSINLATNVTGTLATGNGGTGATSFTAGITMYDQWRLSDDLTGNQEPIGTNLERVDTATQAFIGSGMTESSGIFTFPSTGIYLVRFLCVQNANSAEDYVAFSIQITTNNSSYTSIAQGYEGATTGFAYGGGSIESTMDVTDTSNVKLRFAASQANTSNRIKGQSTRNRTTFTFMRIGDT